MASEEFSRLERLVEQLLDERSTLLRAKQDADRARDALLSEKARIAAELDSLLVKLERLDRNSA